MCYPSVSCKLYLGIRRIFASIIHGHLYVEKSFFVALSGFSENLGKFC